MATAKRRTTAKKVAKARKYEKDPQKKIESGTPWVFHFEIDPDVGRSLIDEKKKAPKGTEFGFLINTRLRKSFGIKQQPAA